MKASALLLLPLCAALQNASTSCAPYHIIMARGTSESYPGILSSLTTLILADFSSANYEDIRYPATRAESSNAGRRAFETQLYDYTQRCVESKIVVLGYSQGALITSDALFGGGDGTDTLGPETNPLTSTTTGRRIAALVLYGDSRHMPEMPFNRGNGTFAATGIFPRTVNQVQTTLDRYVNVTVDFCNAGDPVCASGDVLEAHYRYPEKCDVEAAAFVKKRLLGCP